MRKRKRIRKVDSENPGDDDHQRSIPGINTMPIASSQLESSDVAAFRALNADERQRRTGWIPSLTSGITADAWDAREMLASAMSAILPVLGDSSVSQSEASNEIARRRQSNDTFLEQLAVKYGTKHHSRSGSNKKVKKNNVGCNTKRPNDMEFVMFQDQIGLDAGSIARKKQRLRDAVVNQSSTCTHHVV